MKTRTTLIFFATLLLLLIEVGGCGDPLSVDTPRRIIPVNIDSVLLSEPFLDKLSDTLFAVIDGVPTAFNSEMLRPIFYNKNVAGEWYISVQGSRYDVKGSEYESLSLRLDGIGDTGTFSMQGDYSVPKKVDPSAPLQYAARYEERNGGLTLSYALDRAQPSGEIRVVGIDAVHGVMVGTFSFTGKDSYGKTIRVQNGIFRLRLQV